MRFHKTIDIRPEKVDAEYSQIHKFTQICIFVFAHKTYIIYNIIILLWRFYQATQMCESVNL